MFAKTKDSPPTPSFNHRIQSLDILRGLVMALMVLDHARAYFHYGTFYGNPTDIDTTTPILFFTRFITHYCAPIFVFLAGAGAFLYGQKRDSRQLFRFLISRGLWLILLEVTVVGFAWTFDISFSFQILQVIWVIGLSMIGLAFMIYLPKVLIALLGLLMVFGHNLLDGIVESGQGISAVAWYLIHQSKFLVLENGTHAIFFHYSIIPWFGVMLLGYVFGTLYTKTFPVPSRRKILLLLGNFCLILFIILRVTNVYGDPSPWQVYPTEIQTFLSFFNLSKYPPSLLYLLITLGPAFILLFLLEKPLFPRAGFLVLFGRVPLFFYVAHLYLLHFVATFIYGIMVGHPADFIFSVEGFIQGHMASHGYPLWVVYLVWVGSLLLLYPLCLNYAYFKRSKRDQWWVSYI